ncbi:DUF1638 domain-containing protein [Desulfoluna sp.]|uniref:DUF1638 domain-containing protein n=1 Tax=Desulfoluna sp. TaxID=2045199 RepID=UPI00262DF049|nr:DUF1638 domain-containing protein [Desulfoluna sp.]
MMNRAVIACEVMRYEMEKLCADSQKEKAPSLHFLRQGLHDTPKLLKEELQAKINEVESANPTLTHLILGYGLCGQGLTGIRAERCELVLPRVHDCIPLLIGSVAAHQKEHSRECGTYWFSPGWLTWSVLPYLDNQTMRLAHYEKQYGSDKAKLLMEMEEGVLANYTRACLIEWPGLGETFRDKAAEAAKRSRLPLSTMKGASTYIKALLFGPWDTSQFVRIPPGQILCQSMDTEEVFHAEKPALPPKDNE